MIDEFLTRINFFGRRAPLVLLLKQFLWHNFRNLTAKRVQVTLDDQRRAKISHGLVKREQGGLNLHMDWWSLSKGTNLADFDSETCANSIFTLVSER